MKSIGRHPAWPRWPQDPSGFPAAWRDGWAGGVDRSADSAYAWLPDEDGWDQFEWGSDWAAEVESLYTPHDDLPPARDREEARSDRPGSSAP